MNNFKCKIAENHANLLKRYFFTMVHALVHKTMVFLQIQWLSFNLVIIIFSFENDFRNTNDVSGKKLSKGTTGSKRNKDSKKKNC